MKGTRFRKFDVRQILAAGREPLPEILQQVEKLGAGEGLTVIAPFLPSPLVQLLKGEGFTSRTEQRGPAEWHVHFWREGASK